MHLGSRVIPKNSPYPVLPHHSGSLRHFIISSRPSDTYMRQYLILGSDRGLTSFRCQAIIRTNARLQLITPLGTNFNDMTKWWPFCLGLNCQDNTESYMYLPSSRYHWIQHGAIGPLYVTFSYSTWIFCRGISRFATDCPCDVWCRGLTTCLLHVGPPFGNRFLNKSWAVGLT